MKLLIEVFNKKHLFLEKVDGIILPLKDFSVESNIYFSLEEIKKISEECSKEIFVKINKNLFNDDIEKIRSILLDLNQMHITGVFYYDLAILELYQELHLDFDLVWNQTHMVNNYQTCNYYFSKGVGYALVGKELTLDEIIEIIRKSKMQIMVEVVSKPSIAFSRRKLLTNYGKDIQKNVSSPMVVSERVGGKFIQLWEDKNGTSFFLDTVMNGTGVIKDLFDANCSYILIKEWGIEDDFEELVCDTKDYIMGNCCDISYVEKYQKLGNYTNFFFQKTIYRVK